MCFCACPQVVGSQGDRRPGSPRTPTVHYSFQDPSRTEWRLGDSDTRVDHPLRFQTIPVYPNCRTRQTLYGYGPDTGHLNYPSSVSSETLTEGQGWVVSHHLWTRMKFLVPILHPHRNDLSGNRRRLSITRDLLRTPTEIRVVSSSGESRCHGRHLRTISSKGPGVRVLHTCVWQFTCDRIGLLLSSTLW